MGGLYAKEFIERLQGGVESLTNQWGLSSHAQVSLLTVSENATFKVTDALTDRQIVVRVHRPGYHTKAEIASELSWIEALRKDSVVTTPAPVPMLNGQIITGFDDQGTHRDAVAFEFMQGEEPGQTAKLEAGFQELGAISARLHQHTKHWRRPTEFVRKTWNFETIAGHSAHWGPWQAALGLNDEGHAILQRAVEQLERQTNEYSMSGSRFGLIHADLRLANLLDDGERLGVIDFDDCGFGWYGYDFAAAVSFIEREPYIGMLFDSWVTGYRHVAALSDEDEAMIPTFVMLRRLQLTAWIASHSETPTAQEFGDGFTEGTIAMAEKFLKGERPFDE